MQTTKQHLSIVSGRCKSRSNSITNSKLLHTMKKLFHTAAIFLLSISFFSVQAQPDCSAPAAPNVNWSGCNKSGIILFNQNLTGANLTNAILVGTEFTGSNLSGADLTSANLLGGGLGGTNLAGANLAGANLNGLTSGGIVGTPSTLPVGWALVSGYLVGPGANLYDANLSGANLTNFNLSGATLWNTDLSGANLTGANLTNTNFNGVNLSGATLTGVVSGGITGNPSALPAGWALVNGYLVTTPPETRLRSVDCGKINLIPSAQIACNIVSGASNYEWEFRSISNNAVYATRITSSYIIAPFMVTPTLQWNTQYNCRVRAKVGGFWGNYGTSCVIGLMQNPAITGVPATIIRPQFCNVTNLALTSTIACQSVSMWSLYQYEFTDILTNQVIIKQVGSIYLVLNTVAPALLPGRTYQVRVRGYVYNTWSTWSATCSIGISSGISAREISISTDADGNETIVENEITMDASINESIFNLSVYPNPFNQQATLFIQSSKSDKAQVQIFDMVGNLVWNEQVNTNTNVTIGNDFATGTYIVKVLNESGEQAIHRMIKTN
jgi:hypothetical protein